MRISFFALAMPLLALASPVEVTYYKDVLPVLQKNCQSCHRPGETAPMSFLSYKETRPWAKGIKQAVSSRKMPPWFADPRYGKFHNDRSLAEKDSQTLISWADSGATEGNPSDAPKPIQWTKGWQIGEPDLIVEMPKDYEIPAEGTIDYQYFVLPLNLKEDKWIQLAEARPGNPQLVHHIIAFIRPPGSKWMASAVPGEPFNPRTAPRTGLGEERNGFSDMVAGFAPGTLPNILQPGQGRLIPAGSDIVFQMHYTANGKPGRDRSKLGLIFAKQPPVDRVFYLAAGENKFRIPPGADNHRVDASFTLQSDATLISMLPHMHLRGKSFEYRATFPDGKTETLLSVPHYSFSWQLGYFPEKPMLLPKGTKIDVTAHFDNSANNKANPNPQAEVRYGDQSWEEMMIGFFEVSIPVGMDPVKVMRPERKPKPAED